MPEVLNEKLFYNTVLCQTFSPTGNFLLAGNIYGDVSVFNLSKVLGPRQTENENEVPGPTYKFSAHPESHVQSMAAMENFLVTGSMGEISGWDWKIILSNKAPKAKAAWTVQIPTDKDSFEKPDVNCLVYCKENNLLYAGCGDNKVYVIHLEDGRILRQLEGHKDYIHSISRILSKVLGPRQTENENEVPGPTYKFSAHPESHVQSMAAMENFLVTGSTGEISGWDWKIILSNKAPKAKAAWTVQIPTDKDSFEKPDVNCLVYCKENNLLYAGCGDNKVYVIHLEDGRILRQLEGHKDYIHSISRMNGQLASASEDGTVRLWDLRKYENTNILTPHLNNKVARPHLGKWIGAVDTTEDWLLCGGGPSLSLWHLRTMEAAMVFDLQDSGIHVAEIYEERIIAGGAMPYTYHLTYQNEVLAKVQTSSSTVYSIALRETPHKILSVAGSSNNIDICTNFNYRELVIKFA